MTARTDVAGEKPYSWQMHTSLQLHEGIYAAVSRKVVGRNARATIPKGNMGYDQYAVRNDWKCPSPKIFYFLIWNYTLLK